MAEKETNIEDKILRAEIITKEDIVRVIFHIRDKIKSIDLPKMIFLGGYKRHRINRINEND